MKIIIDPIYQNRLYFWNDYWRDIRRKVTRKTYEFVVREFPTQPNSIITVTSSEMDGDETTQ